MALVLYYHPLASFCHKVLIALYENQTPFTARHVDLADPASYAELAAHWPVGKIPVLVDEARAATIPETTIILEYLETHHAARAPLLPREPDGALQARLWDRFFDLYVSVPMQKIVGDRLRPSEQRDGFGVEEARKTLRVAYATAEKQLARNTFAIGEAFSIADCSAAPALFYAEAVEPFSRDFPKLAAYFERLLQRPSYARTLEEARPYLQFFPMYDQLQPRFRVGTQPARGGAS